MIEQYNGLDLHARIVQAIRSFGWAAEHNADYFFHLREQESKNALFLSHEGYAILAQLNDDEWSLFFEPIAPREARAVLIKDFCVWALANTSIKKVVIEVTSDTRHDLLSILPPGLRPCAIAETLVWPILDLRNYNPALLGPFYKSLRNVRNRFTRDHSLEVKDARHIPREVLKGIIDRWKKNRKATHRVFQAPYYGIIDDDFHGVDDAFVLIVDKVPEGLSAGWLIPRTSWYYLAVSVHSYAHWGLGEVLIMEALNRLKQQQITAVDIGGSDKNLLRFKSQFGNVTTYKTHRFSIVRRT